MVAKPLGVGILLVFGLLTRTAAQTVDVSKDVQTRGGLKSYMIVSCARPNLASRGEDGVSHHGDERNEG
jgi:hypothetical protein